MFQYRWSAGYVTSATTSCGPKRFCRVNPTTSFSPELRRNRVTVTCDTDFGELAFRSGLPAECGVVLLRIQWWI